MRIGVRRVEAEDLKGHKFDEVYTLGIGSDVLCFVDHLHGAAYLFGIWRERICECSLSIEDICGNLDNLVNSPIVMSDESSSPEGSEVEWTFYKFATTKGYVTVRFTGSGSEYYSETCEIIKVPIKKDFSKKDAIEFARYYSD